MKLSIPVVASLVAIGLGAVAIKTILPDSSTPSSQAGLTIGHDVNPSSLKSVRNMLNDLRADAKRRGVSGEEAGLDYYESFEYFLEERVNPGEDQIDVDAYKRSWNHVNNMPPAEGVGGPRSLTSLWTYIGPKNMDVPYRTYYGVRPIAGRINCLAYHPSNANIMYAGAGMGGVFKSTNGGTTWTQLNSDKWDSLTVSAIAIDPTNPNVIYVGTGDHHGGVPFQMGIMKTTDGGATWTNYGQADFGNTAVSDIIIDPDDNQRLVLSAGRGSALGRIWYSTNAGVTWNASDSPGFDYRGLSVSSAGGASKPWYAASAGGLFKSVNGGQNWTQVTTPFGAAADVACSRRTSGDGPDTFYVLDTSGRRIFRSTTAGASFDNVTNNFPTGSSNYNWSQSSYDFWIGTSVNGSDDSVFVGLITVAASKDRGATWADIGITYTSNALTHNDQHCFAHHPTINNQFLIGGDGGIFRTVYNPTNETATFTGLSAQLPVTMFYAMATHPTDHTRVLGGTQDNASPNANGDLSNWNCRWAGDGAFCAINQVNPLIQISSSQNLGVYRTTNEWAGFNDITPNKTGESAAFIAPLTLSVDQSRIIALTNRFRVWNGSWNNAGSGQVIASSGNGRCIGLSPSDNARVYTGASNGEVWMCTNFPTASAWTQINSGSTSLPNRSIKDISVDPSDSSDVLVAVAGTGTGHLWRCTNTQAGTRVWTDVSGTGGTALPDVPANTIARDPFDPDNTWYVGTDLGVFRTNDAGATWSNATEPLGLPNVRVNDLEVNAAQGYMYAATYGRGMWRIGIREVALSQVIMPYAGCVGGFDFLGTVKLTAAAPSAGTPVSLTSDKPAVLSVPATVTVPSNATSTTFQVETNPTATEQTVTLTGNYNGVNKTDTIIVRPPNVVTFKIVLTFCAGGRSVTGTVTLNGDAPAGGRTVNLTDNSAFATMPSSVLVTQGTRSKSFTINTSAVTSTQTVTVTATTGTVSKAAILTIYQLLLSAVNISPPVVQGGGSTGGTVTVTHPAPAGGANILLSSNKPQAIVPASVTVAQGATSRAFAVNTLPVASNTVVTITAKRGPVTKATSVTVAP